MRPVKGKMKREDPKPENCSSPEEFAEALGRAIIAFQSIESRSANVFMWLLQANLAGSAPYRASRRECRCWISV